MQKQKVTLVFVVLPSTLGFWMVFSNALWCYWPSPAIKTKLTGCCVHPVPFLVACDTVQSCLDKLHNNDPLLCPKWDSAALCTGISWASSHSHCWVGSNGRNYDHCREKVSRILDASGFISSVHRVAGAVPLYGLYLIEYSKLGILLIAFTAKILFAFFSASKQKGDIFMGLTIMISPKSHY